MASPAVTDGVNLEEMDSKLLQKEINTLKETVITSEKEEKKF